MTANGHFFSKRLAPLSRAVLVHLLPSRPPHASDAFAFCPHFAIVAPVESAIAPPEPILSLSVNGPRLLKTKPRPSIVLWFAPGT